MKSLLPILALAIVTTGCGLNDPKGARDLVEADNPEITQDDFLVTSELPRSRGLDVIDSRFERDQIVAGTLPTGYRTVPVIKTDDEGKDGINVNTRTGLGRPTVNCGLDSTFVTTTQKIDNCVAQNGTAASWNGTSNGIAGEAIWKLVARFGANEMWLDTRTGFIWSDMVDSTNWCKASGNKEKIAAIDCSVEATTTPSCVGANLFSITNITWRLPTRNDYLQADLDGLRFVARNTSTTGYWTATLDSSAADRNSAWVYVQDQGTLEKATLATIRNVRCVGAAPL